MKQTKEKTVYSCEYCGKQYTKMRARSNHQALCQLNPKSIQIYIDLFGKQQH